MAEIFIGNDSVLSLEGLKNGLAVADTGLRTLNVGSATTITRDSGDFTADGFLADQEIELEGFPITGNNSTFTLAIAAASTLTINEGGLTAGNGDGKERVKGFSFLNAATVTVTLKDEADGTEVSGETWPLSMSYVTGSNGIYRATLADTLSLSEGSSYLAEISANAGAGLQGFFTLTLKAKVRKSS